MPIFFRPSVRRWIVSIVFLLIAAPTAAIAQSSLPDRVAATAPARSKLEMALEASGHVVASRAWEIGNIDGRNSAGDERGWLRLFAVIAAEPGHEAQAARGLRFTFGSTAGEWDCFVDEEQIAALSDAIKALKAAAPRMRVKVAEESTTIAYTVNDLRIGFRCTIRGTGGLIAQHPRPAGSPAGGCPIDLTNLDELARLIDKAQQTLHENTE